jgi:hypothetical protein
LGEEVERVERFGLRLETRFDEDEEDKALFELASEGIGQSREGSREQWERAGCRGAPYAGRDGAGEAVGDWSRSTCRI